MNGLASEVILFSFPLISFFDTIPLLHNLWRLLYYQNVSLTYLHLVNIQTSIWIILFRDVYRRDLWMFLLERLEMRSRLNFIWLACLGAVSCPDAWPYYLCILSLELFVEHHIFTHFQRQRLFELFFHNNRSHRIFFPWTNFKPEKLVQNYNYPQ